jgi:hypothetical protein
MSQIFTIENDRVVIKKLAVEAIEGNITHNGNLNLTGPVEITSTLTVDTIKVKNLEAANGVNTKFGEWVVKEEADLLGKGLLWTWNSGSVQVGYMSGNRLWTSSDFDLESDKSYMIDGIPVLSKTELSPQVTKSRLREVGTLKNIVVSGNAALADFAIFNSELGRLGLNTESPNATLSVVDNDVEIVLGSPSDGVAQIGTYTSSDLNIVTDHTPRISIKSGGEVIVNGDLTIKGILKVDSIVTDSRIDRFSPLEFKTSRDRGIYGLGMVWSGTGATKQLIMMADPDRLWTTESLDLSEGRNYYINGESVLSSSSLGNNVTQSNLSKLGTLEYLNVQGEATFMTRINASRAVLNAKTILFNDGDEFTITNSKLTASSKLSFNINTDEVMYASADEIILGNHTKSRRPVKIHGRLTVGINNPDEDVDLAVNGNISFSGKKFITGMSAPENGSYSKGDICWNEDPTSATYVGWVCTEAGAPGRWLPFGAIARQ